jgi:hypothetical protein
MNSISDTKCLSRLLVLGVTACTVCFWHSNAGATQDSSWDVAVLDEVLATLPPGESLAQIGDMQVRPDLLLKWRNKLAGQPGINFAFDGVAPAWTGGNVYYTFDASVSTAKQKAFLDGAAEWALFANLQFIPRTAEVNYVTIKENPAVGGGQSAVGMVGGQQFIEFGTNAWSRAVICHEIGHALGLVHEHQRSDRDSYVTVFTNNIQPGFLSAFVKLGSTVNVSTYDFLSVMHYRRDAYSTNAALVNTIEPLPAYAPFLNVMGQQFDPVLSASDRAGMAARYGAGPVLTSVVTNTSDNGPGSLRAALYYAFDHPGTTVTFNIPTSDSGYAGGVFTIRPTDNLPGLICATTLDGSSEPTNSNPNGPEIMINGSLCDPISVYSDGLRITGTNCVVQGLVINGFPGSGIVIDGPNATGNVVRGCYLNVNASGTAADTNRDDGLVISGGASFNTIGGTNAAQRNLISGSAHGGLVIRNSGTRSNLVAGNYIGLNAAGTAALPNANSGVLIYNGAQGNVIGGTNSGAGNVISGNGYEGLGIADAGSTGNVVAGNVIGLNATGTAAISNAWQGVSLFNGASSNTVGGTVIGARNVISGNGQQGLTLSDAGTDGNVVLGNYIGLNVAGTAAVANGWSGLQLYGGPRNNTIGGATPAARNVISGNSFQGVVLSDPSTRGNLIVGNYVGLNAAGTAALANGWTGVDLQNATTNTVGDASAGAGNVISGNGNNGMVVRGAGNAVAGNIIGLDAAGTAAVPNTWSGLVLDDTRGSSIGGANAGAGNTISGNQNFGVLIIGANTAGNSVQGNRIGLNAAGTQAIGNGWTGLSLYSGAHDNVVGGAIPGAGNTISGNLNYGIDLSGTNTTGNLIQGNRIGVDAGGTQGVANLWAGVGIYGGANGNTIGLSVNGSGAGNQVAFNSGDGIVVFDPATTNNVLRGNNVSSNGGLGINLFGSDGFWGVTYNDFDDSDTGPNQLQNYPVLTNAVGSGPTTILGGTFNGAPNRTLIVDLYRSVALDVSGYGEGEQYMGSVSVTTDGSGLAGFVTSVSGNLANQYLTTTATDQATGNTSEFSAGLLVVDGPAWPAFAGPTRLTSTGFLAQISLNLGQDYRVQATTNLATPVVWTDLTNFTASVTNYTLLDHAATNLARRFYRVVSP